MVLLLVAMVLALAGVTRAVSCDSVQAYNRGVAVTLVDACAGLELKMYSVGNNFTPFLGISFQASSLPDSGPYPTALSFNAVVWGADPVWALSYTRTCGEYDGVIDTVDTSTDYGDYYAFNASCSALAAPIDPATPLFSYAQTNLTIAVPGPVPADASSLDLVLLNVPAGGGAYIGSLTFTYSDDSVVEINPAPCSGDVLRVSTCKCASCCYSS